MKLRSHISVLMAFFLLVSNLGMAINVHFCDDEIASISINSDSNSFEIEKDCCGKIEKKSKCCSTKIIKSQEKSDQVVVKSFSLNTDVAFLSDEWKPFVFASNFNFKKRDNVTYYCDANAPPLYLLYSQYTFYS